MSAWLQFPGAAEAGQAAYGPVTQASTLQGVVIVVGGARDPVPVHLQDGGRVHDCVAKRVVAKDLARYIFGPPLRVSGNGRWSRDSRGEWSMSRFQITEFTRLEDDPLGKVVADLREMAGTTREPAGALETLTALRSEE